MVEWGVVRWAVVHWGMTHWAMVERGMVRWGMVKVSEGRGGRRQFGASSGAGELEFSESSELPEFPASRGGVTRAPRWPPRGPGAAPRVGSKLAGVPRYCESCPAMRLITDAEVASLITMREAIAAMTAAFEQMGNGAVALAPRVRGAAEHHGQVAAIAAMGAALPAAGVVGAKVYSTVKGQFNFVIVLFSAQTGQPLAAIDANEITRFRTAAASAVALRALAAREARTLAVFGTGVQARAHAEAFLLTRPFERVLVAGRAGAPGLADWVTASFGVPAQAVDAATAAREADVLATCTRAVEPLFDGTIVKPGAFVAAVGSSKPQARELDDALLARADLIAVEWLPAAQAEAGEFVRAAVGVIDPARVVELGKLLVGGHPYQRRAPDVVVYKSVGIGLEDVALAKLVWDRAQ